MQRLDKTISSQLNLSRSEARNHIKWGFVIVDGDKIHDPGFLVDPEKSQIKYKGKYITYKEHIYILMNKPKGVLSASEDKKRETVVDLVPDELSRQGLFPVGRLDKDTTGLLIITDDGDFAHNVISPKKNVMKTYIATLDGEINDSIIAEFKKGVVLADGTKCREAILRNLGENRVEITICEGKYHQIKRMFGVFDLGVNDLERVALGGLKLPNDLKTGECRELTKAELDTIY